MADRTYTPEELKALRMAGQGPMPTPWGAVKDFGRFTKDVVTAPGRKLGDWMYENRELPGKIGEAITAPGRALGEAIYEEGEKYRGIPAGEFPYNPIGEAIMMGEPQEPSLDKIVPPEELATLPPPEAPEPESAIKDKDVRKYLEKKFAPKKEEPLKEKPEEAPEEVLPTKEAAPSRRERLEKYRMPEELSDAALSQAQKKQRNIEMLADIMGSVDYAAAAMTGRTPREKFYAKLRQSARRPVEEIAERRAGIEQERAAKMKGMQYEAAIEALAKSDRANDPNSEESQRARYLLSLMDPNLTKDPNFQTLTAAETDDAIKVLGLREQIATRKESAAARAATSKEKAEDKRKRELEKDFMTLSQKIMPELLRRNKAFGRNAENYRQSGAILALAKQIKEHQNYNPDSRQMYEVARSLDSLLSGGTGTIRGTEELIPKTAAQKYATLKEWLTAKPHEAELKAFIQRTVDTVNRERKYARKQIKSSKMQLLEGFQHLRKEDPEQFNRILKAHNLKVTPEGNFDVIPEAETEFGEAIPEQDEKIIEWADRYNMPYEQAEKILRSRGYGR